MRINNILIDIIEKSKYFIATNLKIFLVIIIVDYCSMIKFQDILSINIKLEIKLVFLLDSYYLK